MVYSRHNSSNSLGGKSSFSENDILQSADAKKYVHFQRLRTSLFLLTCFYIVFYVGAFSGFGPMEIMLENDGAYAHKCTKESPCNAQAHELIQVALIAAVLAQLSTPIAGAISDRYGPVVLQIAIFFVGCLGMGFILISSATQISDLLYPAFILIGIMSMGTAPMIMQMAQLYTLESSRGRVINVLESLWAVGGGLGYWILWAITKAGLSFRIVIGCYLALGFIVYLATILLWKAISTFLRTQTDKQRFLDGEGSVWNSTSERNMEDIPVDTSVTNHETFFQQAKSYRFILISSLFAIHVARMSFTLSTAKDFLASLGDNALDGKYLSIFSLSSPIVLLGLPLVELFVKKCGYIFALQSVNVVAIAHGIVLLASKNLNAQVVGFVLFMFYRCFLLSVCFSYLETFAEKHALGKLTGLVNVAPGLVILLNIPLTQWALVQLKGDFFWPNFTYTMVIVPLVVGVWYLGRLYPSKGESVSKEALVA